MQLSQLLQIYINNPAMKIMNLTPDRKNVVVDLDTILGNAAFKTELIELVRDIRWAAYIYEAPMTAKQHEEVGAFMLHSRADLLKHIPADNEVFWNTALTKESVARWTERMTILRDLLDIDDMERYYDTIQGLLEEFDPNLRIDRAMEEGDLATILEMKLDKVQFGKVYGKLSFAERLVMQNWKPNAPDWEQLYGFAEIHGRESFESDKTGPIWNAILDRLWDEPKAMAVVLKCWSLRWNKLAPKPFIPKPLPVRVGAFGGAVQKAKTTLFMTKPPTPLPKLELSANKAILDIISYDPKYTVKNFRNFAWGREHCPKAAEWYALWKWVNAPANQNAESEHKLILLYLANCCSPTTLYREKIGTFGIISLMPQLLLKHVNTFEAEIRDTWCVLSNRVHKMTNKGLWVNIMKRLNLA